MGANEKKINIKTSFKAALSYHTRYKGFSAFTDILHIIDR